MENIEVEENNVTELEEKKIERVSLDEIQSEKDDELVDKIMQKVLKVK